MRRSRCAESDMKRAYLPVINLVTRKNATFRRPLMTTMLLVTVARLSMDLEIPT
jgi:hypothetical protein